MLNIGPQELILVLIVALVVVGPQKLPELGRTIGKAVREFRKIQDDVKDTMRFDLDDDPEPYIRPTTTPRTPTPEPDAGSATGALPVPLVPVEAPDAATDEAPIVTDGSGDGHAADDAPNDATVDPEPRAAE